MEEIVKRLFDNRRLSESARTNAWHLRQDGKAFPVKVHMYCEGDDTLDSEAEVASFLIKTDSKDQDRARYALNAWMALMIQNDIDYDDTPESLLDHVKERLQSLPYKFQYSLTDDQYLSMFKSLNLDVDSYYEFLDEVNDELENVQDEMRKSINQQFCRVRVGGQYNSDEIGQANSIWFRVSSVGYNWVNTIYVFADSIKREYKIRFITVCRDAESDNKSEDVFYKAKDGDKYYMMPIEEFLSAEHESNPYFESYDVGAGVKYTARKMLATGHTYNEVVKYMKENHVDYLDKIVWHRLLNENRKDYIS